MDRFKSKKFVADLVADIGGVVTMVIGAQAGDIWMTVAGAAVTVACVLGYLKVQGDIDKTT